MTLPAMIEAVQELQENMVVEMAAVLDTVLTMRMGRMTTEMLEGMEAHPVVGDVVAKIAVVQTLMAVEAVMGQEAKYELRYGKEII